MESLFEFGVAAFLIIAGIFGLVGSYGLIKLDDPMSRLHAPTKATTLGVGGVLLASMLHSWGFEEYPSFHELMITLFLFLTAPVTAHFIAKVHIHRRERRETMPSPGEDTCWATHAGPEEVQNAKDPAGEDKAG
ncbi:Na+/H+ antiporter subunit G [Cribrihabitans neustonicus]|uniref:Na+/H+ antiporter subunit G n=1 Tax=Cribrihabitans neustonicus TaxID=1429085 RepID=UPI003B5AECD3